MESYEAQVHVGGVQTELMKGITANQRQKIIDSIVEAMGKHKKLPTEVADKFGEGVIKAEMTHKEITNAVSGISEASLSRYLQIANSLPEEK